MKRAPPSEPIVPPEPQITDFNPVPALMLAAGRLMEAGDKKDKCLWQTLGIAFEGAVLADNDPEKRGHISKAWKEAEGKTPRMDDFGSLLRHVVMLTLSPQHPKAVRQDASFYTRAIIELPRTMRAVEVAKALEAKGLKKRASEIAERRAALKASAPPGEVTSDDPSNEDQSRSPEPHGGDLAVLGDRNQPCRPKVQGDSPAIEDPPRSPEPHRKDPGESNNEGQPHSPELQGDNPSVPSTVAVNNDVVIMDESNHVALTVEAEHDAMRVLHEMSMNGQAVALITCSTSGKFRIEGARIMKP
jgi:hypothetical protein